MAAGGPDDWVAGIDLGGTNVRAAAVDRSGAVLELLSEPVQRSGGSAAPPFAQLVELVGRLVGSRPRPLVAIGIGATGPVYSDRGVIDNPHTLPPSMQGNVVATLRGAFAVPVVLENDADAAALGEASHGAAVGAELTVSVTVGTGIGVGAVRAGCIVRGAGGSHGEAGHMVLDPAGPECYCGARGCLESLASGSAIAARARAGGLVDASHGAAEVQRLAAAGDRDCARILGDARTALGHGVWNLAAMLAPDVIVLSGNALGDPDAVRERVGAMLATSTMGPPTAPDVRLARLGERAGCVGAARAARGARAALDR